MEGSAPSRGSVFDSGNLGMPFSIHSNQPFRERNLAPRVGSLGQV